MIKVYEKIVDVNRMKGGWELYINQEKLKFTFLERLRNARHGTYKWAVNSWILCRFEISLANHPTPTRELQASDKTLLAILLKFDHLECERCASVYSAGKDPWKGFNLKAGFCVVH